MSKVTVPAVIGLAAVAIGGCTYKVDPSAWAKPTGNADVKRDVYECKRDASHRAIVGMPVGGMIVAGPARRARVDGEQFEECMAARGYVKGER